jgi:hypothetical protein
MAFRLDPPHAAKCLTIVPLLRPGDGNSFSGNRDEPIVYNGDKV